MNQVTQLPIIQIELQRSGLYVPTLSSEKSAEYKLYLQDNIQIPPKTTMTVSMGYKIRIIEPEPQEQNKWITYIQICGRCLIQNEFGCIVFPSIIDANRPEELKLYITNTTNETVSFNKGTRIAKMIVKSTPVCNMIVVPDEEDSDDPAKKDNISFGQRGRRCTTILGGHRNNIIQKKRAGSPIPGTTCNNTNQRQGTPPPTPVKKTKN